MALLEQGGYSTRSAATGAQALALLAQPTQLVVLDVMLPDTDGLAVCRHIRALTPYVPILMLSARDEVTDKVIGLELGADEYVTKPFEPRELLVRVRAMLRFAGRRAGGQHLDEQALVCGPIMLWPAEHRADLNGQPLDLAPDDTTSWR